MTVRIQFQLRDEVAEELQRLAANANVSRQAFVQGLIMGVAPAVDAVSRPSTREGEAGQRAN